MLQLAEKVLLKRFDSMQMKSSFVMLKKNIFGIILVIRAIYTLPSKKYGYKALLVELTRQIRSFGSLRLIYIAYS